MRGQNTKSESFRGGCSGVFTSQSCWQTNVKCFNCFIVSLHTFSFTRTFWSLRTVAFDLHRPWIGNSLPENFSCRLIECSRCNLQYRYVVYWSSRNFVFNSRIVTLFLCPKRKMQTKQLPLSHAKRHRVYCLSKVSDLSALISIRLSRKFWEKDVNERKNFLWMIIKNEARKKLT